MSASNKPKIAIIGAGLAGLTAALRLHQKNYDVTLYEARERVGGRVFTILMKNIDGTESIVEVGGQNITDGGEAANLLKLARELGLKIKTKEVTLSSLVHWEGEYIDFQSLLNQLNLAPQEINSCIDSAVPSSSSMADLLEKLFSRHPCLKMALETKLTAYEGVPVKNQSLYHNIDTLKCMLKGGLSPAHEQLNSNLSKIIVKTIEGGNAQLPLKIAAQLDDKLRLNKALRTVKSHDNQIELQFHDGAVACYDKVIMAIPASVYGDIVFEDSLLPKSRLQKFSKIGYGKNYKVFTPIHIPPNKTHRSIVTNQQVSFFNDDEKVMVMYCGQPLNSISEEITIVQNGYGIHGDHALRHCIIKDQHFCLHTEIATHSWADDPYAKGSYSGYCVELSQELDKRIDYKEISIKEIFEPINDRLFFIGEHTTLLEEIGTMEAAVESAERIAKIFP